MGKSPGKWIKTVLFGKKSSKSNLSKGVPLEKKAAAEAPAADLGLSHSGIPDTTYQSVDRAEKAEPEIGIPGSVPCEAASSLTAKQGVDLQDTAGLNSADEEERAKQEEAATKAQAAFRGYLARRAFRALKGIIRLQALIRGHLVRRQAVATLRCMQSIVRLQALARGQRVGLLGVKTSVLSGKLAKNAFARKLLISLPTAMPLSLQYDLAEPNSAWVWLERWSLIRFWEPVVEPKNVEVKCQGKQANAQIPEPETGKSRRTFRKVAATATGDSIAADAEKPRRNVRKTVNHQMESQEPQNELERVKRNLRKVSAAATVVGEKSEIEHEKPQQNVRKPSNVTASDVPEPINTKVSENPADSTVAVDESTEMEIPLKPLTVDELVDLPHADHPAIEQPSLENDAADISTAVQEEESIKEDQSGKENQRARRRKSFPVKQEFPENVSQNTPSLPSYMAATESAKAKLRMQGAVKLSDEGVENGFVRRHSLPSSTNGKLSSLSPRIQKPAQANGKGGSKSNKSLSASKDERVLQPGWRR